MAHFNPAVTVAFLITKHLERKKGLLLIYLFAEILGGILASFFIYFIFGNEMNLGANAPNYTDFPIFVIIGSEIFASALLIIAKRVLRASSSHYNRIREHNK
jgi:aquaporin Z